MPLSLSVLCTPPERAFSRTDFELFRPQGQHEHKQKCAEEDVKTEVPCSPTSAQRRRCSHHSVLSAALHVEIVLPLPRRLSCSLPPAFAQRDPGHLSIYPRFATEAFLGGLCDSNPSGETDFIIHLCTRGDAFTLLSWRQSWARKFMWDMSHFPRVNYPGNFHCFILFHSDFKYTYIYLKKMYIYFIYMMVNIKLMADKILCRLLHNYAATHCNFRLLTHTLIWSILLFLF